MTHDELGRAFQAHKLVRGRCLDSEFHGVAPVPFPSINGNPPVHRDNPFYDARFWAANGDGIDEWLADEDTLR